MRAFCLLGTKTPASSVEFPAFFFVFSTSTNLHIMIFTTMKEKKDFKIVIAGGSVAGLTVANMLQLYGIDYILLEAYPHIAPQVGASIGLLPHGNRILDQLGLFSKILALAPPIDSFCFRKETGDLVVSHKGMNASFMERQAFPSKIANLANLKSHLGMAIQSCSSIAKWFSKSSMKISRTNLRFSATRESQQ